jgi:hypothetical protein
MQPWLGERDRLPSGDGDVVQEPDVHQGRRLSADSLVMRPTLFLDI